MNLDQLKLIVVVQDQRHVGDLLTIAEHFAHAGRIAELCFVYVECAADIPSELREQFPALAATPSALNADEVRHAVEREISARPALSSIGQLAHEIVPKRKVSPIVKLARHREASMILVNTWPSDDDTIRRFARGILHQSPCSVMIVPQGSAKRLQRVLVAMDFSEHSDAAFSLTLKLFSRIPEAAIKALHTFTVPVGYHATGKTHDEFVEVLKKTADEMFGRLLVAHGAASGALPVPVEPMAICSRHPAQTIVEVAQAETCDLIVMGSRGRTAVTGLLVGSVAEEIVKSTPLPVLCHRRKGDYVGLLEALGLTDDAIV